MYCACAQKYNQSLPSHVSKLLTRAGCKSSKILSRIPNKLATRMATLFGKIDKLDASKENWTQYVERIGHFFQTNDIADGQE